MGANGSVDGGQGRLELIRRSVRLDASWPVELWCLDSGDVVSGRCRNISTHGMGISVVGALKPGVIVWLVVKRDDSNCEVAAEVCWCDKISLGVRILHITPEFLSLVAEAGIYRKMILVG